jgi:hypothetical protein
LPGLRTTGSAATGAPHTCLRGAPERRFGAAAAVALRKTRTVEPARSASCHEVSLLFRSFLNIEQALSHTYVISNSAMSFGLIALACGHYVVTPLNISTHEPGRADILSAGSGGILPPERRGRMPHQPAGWKPTPPGLRFLAPTRVQSLEVFPFHEPSF